MANKTLKKNNIAKTDIEFTEKLIKNFIPILLIFGYIILPFLVISVMVNSSPDFNNFFNRLFYSFGLAYLFGGFFLITTKLWAYWDESLINFKIGQWATGPGMEKVFYKIIVPKEYNKPPEAMKAIFEEFWGLNNGIIRTRYEMLNFGKAYYNINFDIMIKNGKTEIYFSFNKKRKEFILKAMQNRFPEIKLVETNDPFVGIDMFWEPGKKIFGNYKKVLAYDLEIKNPAFIPLRDASTLKGNPFTELITSIEKFEPDDNVFIMQFILRPFDTTYKNQWTDEYNKKKDQEYGGEQKLVTEKTANSLLAVENKIKDKHYRCRIKLMFFIPDKKDHYPVIIEKFLRVYFLQTGGGQILQRDDESANDRGFSPVPGLEFLDGILAPIMNSLYFAKENIYRTKMHIEGLVKRSLNISHDPSTLMLSVLELSSLFHFPVNHGIFTEEIKNDEIEEKNKEVSLATQDKIILDHKENLEENSSLKKDMSPHERLSMLKSKIQNK